MKPLLLLAFVTLSALAGAPPGVTTDPADKIGAIRANLNMTLALGGVKADVQFEYGTVSGALTETTKGRKNVPGNVTHFDEFAGPLQPGTTYFFRAKATNNVNTAFGTELQFTTAAAPGAGVTLTPRVLAVVGQPVPNATGATYAKLGPPAVGAFAGKIKLGTRTSPAIFKADGSVAVAAPGELAIIPDSTIIRLGTPSGDAVRASLKPGDGSVLPADKEVILAGLATGPVRIAARTGQELANAAGVSIKSFGAVDGNGTFIFFLAKLQGTGVTPRNDSALCAAYPDGSVRALFREGDAVGSSTATILGALVPAKGTLAEGRWRIDTATFGLAVKRADGKQTLIAVTSAGPIFLLRTTGDAAPAPVVGGLIKTFGLPAFGPPGASAPITLAPDPMAVATDVTRATDTALLYAGVGPSVILPREGDPANDAAGAPLPGATFKSFGTSLLGTGALPGAFTATLTGPTGAAAKGIWITTNTSALKLLARGGDASPTVGKFASFTSLVLPDNATRGPIFTAKLAVEPAAGITGVNNNGIFAVNSTGALIGLLRTGDKITVTAADGPKLRTIKSYAALVPAVKNLGAANGYDNTGKLAVLVTFTDRTIALVEFPIP